MLRKRDQTFKSLQELGVEEERPREPKAGGHHKCEHPGAELWRNLQAL